MGCHGVAFLIQWAFEIVIFPEILEQYLTAIHRIHRSFFWTTGGAGDGEQPWHLQGDTRPRRVGLSDFRGRCPSISIDGLWMFIIMVYECLMMVNFQMVYDKPSMINHILSSFSCEVLTWSFLMAGTSPVPPVHWVPTGRLTPGSPPGIDGRSMIRSSTRSKKIPSAFKSRPPPAAGDTKNHPENHQ